jgi:hypothetical protein
MAVIARFRCAEVVAHEWSSKITLRPVVINIDQEPHSAEIREFFEATPSGEFWAQIRSEKAAAYFKPGKDYYLTIEEAPVA